MKSKLAKLIQIRCVQLSAPKNGSNRCLLSLSMLYCSSDVMEGQHTETFFPAAGQSDNTAFSAPLTPQTSWLGLQVHNPVPQISLQFLGLGSGPCHPCHGQGLQEVNLIPLLTALTKSQTWDCITLPVAHPQGHRQGLRAPVAMEISLPQWNPNLHRGYLGKGLVGIITGEFLGHWYWKQLGVKINTVLSERKI